MLEAGIITIAWFIVKVIIAIYLIIIAIGIINGIGVALLGLLSVAVERSNGSILKVIFKIIAIIIIGGVIGYYISEMVSHLFGNGEYPTSGGVVGLLLIVIYGFGELIGDTYMAVSIFAFIAWLGIIGLVWELLFPSIAEEPPLSEKETIEDDYNKRVGVSVLKKIGIIIVIMFSYLMIVDYLYPNEPISKTQAVIMLFMMFFGWLWISITMPKKPIELETEEEKEMRERKEAIKELNKIAKETKNK